MNAYDELPYDSFPIEWTEPERLALASLLHGGPRMRLDQPYRVLELGCGDGANLLPMAHFRPHSEFVGIDVACGRIAVAEENRAAHSIANVRFIATDFARASEALSGGFDYIICHGVFSWVADETRDTLLVLCSERLRPGGLLYLSYNAKPGWNVRGLVRDFLMTQTARIDGLRARAALARELSARMVESLQGSEHPYSRLLANEFGFVLENPLSHTAHEYLAEHNHAYSRREFLDLVGRNGFAYVADADYNYRSGRVPEGLFAQLAGLGIGADSTDDVADFLYYRQLHSPILTQAGFTRRPPDTAEMSQLVMASNLVERGVEDGVVLFKHSTGFEVRASGPIAAALRLLHSTWPNGLPLSDLFTNVAEFLEDVLLLHRNGLIGLSSSDSGDSSAEPSPHVDMRSDRGGQPVEGVVKSDPGGVSSRFS